MRDSRKHMVAELAVRHSREMSELMESSLPSARSRYMEVMCFRLDRIDNEELKAEWAEATDGGDEDLPFFSEMCLYSLLGKDQARDVLGMMKSLGEKLGFDRMEIERRFRETKVDKTVKVTDADLDALESVVREDGDWTLRGRNKISRVQRAIAAVRKQLADEDEGDST